MKNKKFVFIILFFLINLTYHIAVNAQTARTCTKDEVNLVALELAKFAKVQKQVADNFLSSRKVAIINGNPMVRLAPGDQYWRYLFHCNSCDSHTPARLNKGGQQSCTNCPSPHEPGEIFVKRQELLDKKIVVSAVDEKGHSYEYIDPKVIAVDDKDIARAKSGKKAPCVQCGSSVFKVKGEQCFNCGNLYTPEKPKSSSSSQKPTPPPKSTINKPLVISGIVIGTPIIGTGFYVLNKTTQTTGEITDLSWQTNVIIKKFVPIVRQAFVEDIPSRKSQIPTDGTNAYAGNDGVITATCANKLHSQQPYSCVKVESVNEPKPCGTESVDGENGSAGVKTKFCENWVDKKVQSTCFKDIHKKHCSYNSYHWKQVRNCPNSGEFPSSIDEVTYKQCNVSYAGGEKELRTSSFKMKLSYEYKDKIESHTEELTLVEFTRWLNQTSALLDVAMTGVKSIQHLDDGPIDSE